VVRSNNEKIFNPYHLLRAYEAYNQFFDQCQRDGSDADYNKRDLCWRQMFGYAQRFVPACYAQAFVQGLWNLVKVDGYQGNDWQPEALERNLKFEYDLDLRSYFPAISTFSPAVCSGLGFDFVVLAAGSGVVARTRRRIFGLLFQKLLSSKNSGPSEYYAPRASSVAHS